MHKPESLPYFYQQYFQGLPAMHQQDAGQVNVFRLEDVRVPSAKLISSHLIRSPGFL